MGRCTGSPARVIRSLSVVGGEEKQDGFYEVEEASVASDVADALARDTLQDRAVLVAARERDLCHISAVLLRHRT